MRTVTFGSQEHTRIVVIDARHSTFGNASHKYKIQLVDGKTLGEVNFQLGPVKENGRNGVHNEDLLCIVADRLAGFQGGKFACEENSDALDAVIEALGHLRKRTEIRKARNVEGTNRA